MPHRVERFASTLKQNLAEILARQMNDPRLGPLYVSEVIVAPDLKTARVFISSLYQETSNTPADNPDLLLAELTRSKGFIKRELGKRMYLKYVPELVFMKDEVPQLMIDRE